MGKINKVAVFGMGKSGLAAVALAKKNRQDIYAVNKGERDSWYHSIEGLDRLLGPYSCYSEEEFAQQFHQMDEIVLSPGIPITHPGLAKAVEKGTPILSEIEYAYRHAKDVPVIAVTGTNGKTTTTTMIAEALRKAGKKVFCGGNIGVPYSELALSEEKFDYAVIEVSSFQLETIHQFRPCVGLILNVFPNHSERYESIYDYARAKFRLLNNMSAEDKLIIGRDNPYLEEISEHPVQKYFFDQESLPAEFHFDFSRARVRGLHNKANFYAAYKVLELLGIPRLEELFQAFINEFAGVAHRLEFVLEKEGLSIYNDAKSTNALATTTAIKAFKDSACPLYLVLGGKLRSETDRLLPELTPFKGNISKIFTIGDVTERLALELGNDFEVEKVFDIPTLFKKVRESELKGNLVFSPAFPSFDQFKNYTERGEKFKTWAKEAFN